MRVRKQSLGESIHSFHMSVGVQSGHSSLPFAAAFIYLVMVRLTAVPSLLGVLLRVSYRLTGFFSLVRFHWMVSYKSLHVSGTCSVYSKYTQHSLVSQVRMSF